jgi:hypothetical protein
MTLLLRTVLRTAVACVCLLAVRSAGAEDVNLLADSSFEMTKDKDQFGLVFAKWGGWKYEGDCEFRVGQLAHSGRTSCLLVGRSGPKIRVRQEVTVEPGRYRVTAWLRGLDIAPGTFNAQTEFMFDDKYIQLGKGGSFGWTPLTFVADVPAAKPVVVSFGLMGTGYFWIDDVTLTKVGNDVALTEKPVLGPEAEPLAPPGELTADAVRCPECGYRNQAAWKHCYACGTAIAARSTVASGPVVKPLMAFAERNPFEGTTVVDSPSLGGRALRIDGPYAVYLGPQDWTGYDFLKLDLFLDSKQPQQLGVEIQDVSTRDYWTRVNYTTIIPPGTSTLVVPVKQLYVGEKARPGRMLDLTGICKFAVIRGDNSAPLQMNNLRLERDESPAQARFDGLFAFDLGTPTSPVLEGFEQITPATIYNKGRGYGLKDARIFRAFDALQPDPLYQDFLCIESGGLAVDVPNGRYRVVVNIDSPSGFWGEYQVYSQRAILAQGKPVVSESMDFAAFQKKYFRFWNVEDSPSDNTFDKYQKPYFHEKSFDVDVANGQLQIDFQGENFACCVSSIIVFPAAKASEGERFLKYVEAKRRFYFDNYFKRTLPVASGPPLAPTAADQDRGYVVFQRSLMQDVLFSDRPQPSEISDTIRGSAFAGEAEPLPFAIAPLDGVSFNKEAGVTLAAGDLTGPQGTIPAAAISLGFVSNRLTRISSEGTVYTITPRLVMPGGDVSADGTRRFWPTVNTPADARPGLYRGEFTVTFRGRATRLPVEFRVRAGSLDPIDIPVGPFGHTMGTPWPDSDPSARSFNRKLRTASLRKMREYGFTACSGLPTIVYRGFQNGQPNLDFTQADDQMREARELGFLALVTYGGGLQGIDAYHIDRNQMTAAGLTNYSDFIKRIYSAIQAHADQKGWLPCYYNLCDEPIGDELTAAAENAEAYRAAFPKGPPWFTGASSFRGKNAADPHFRLGRALGVVSWNDHDEDSVALLHKAGSDWAFYNGGNRWTMGDYMFKAAKQFGMKFRVSWHWNAAAGDPYYALDCREDDYAWCSATPDGQLLPSVEFERLRAGLNDYRRLLTLSRLATAQPTTAAGQQARNLIDARMASFHLGQRDHDALFPVNEWDDFRNKVDDLIEALRK